MWLQKWWKDKTFVWASFARPFDCELWIVNCEFPLTLWVYNQLINRQTALKNMGDEQMTLRIKTLGDFDIRNGEESLLMETNTSYKRHLWRMDWNILSNIRYVMARGARLINLASFSIFHNYFIVWIFPILSV